MSEKAFDTLRAAKSLKAAGIDRAQAEAIALVVRDGHGCFSTKSGIQRLEDKISNLRWTVIVIVGLAVALIKLVPPI